MILPFKAVQFVRKLAMQVGWFPTYTMTEDYALGLELKKEGFQCRFVRDYLALGECFCTDTHCHFTILETISLRGGQHCQDEANYWIFIFIFL